MTVVQDLLDPYSLRARLQPALLALAPALVTALVLVPAAWEPMRAVLLVAGAIGGTLLLSHMARDMGKQIESRLYDAWDGKPSVAMLRHRDSRLGGMVKRRYHQLLGRVLGSPLPSEAEEASNPRRADEAYEAASSWLLSRSRDTSTFRVLFAENISYGFRRNLLALRPVSIALSLIGAVMIAVAYEWSWPIAIDDMGVAIWAAAGLVDAFLS